MEVLELEKIFVGGFDVTIPARGVRNMRQGKDAAAHRKKRGWKAPI